MDIFGRNMGDYSHLSMLDREQLAEDYCRGYEHDTGFKYDFEALGSRSNDLITRAESRAQAVGYLTDNLMAVQTQIDEILYSSYRLPKYVPVRGDVPEGARSYSTRILDRVGRGRFISPDGTDAPSASVGMRIENHPTFYGGITGTWTIEDLRQAMFGGVPLDTEVMRSATIGAMEHIESVCLTGGDQFSLTGLTNQATGSGNDRVSRATATAFSGMSGDEMATYIQRQISDMIQDTVEVFGETIQRGLSIYLPVAQYDRLNDARIGDGLRTAWDFLSENNGWTRRTGEMPALHSLTELRTAGNSNTTRMIIAINDPMVMEFAEVITPRVIGVDDSSLYAVKVGMEYKTGQFVLKRPAGMRYYDGV